jgi:adenylate cyclase
LSAAQFERRLAAILAADVAGYSRLIGANEEGTLARLRAHRRELIEPKIAEHRGRIVKTTGDGALVEFASTVDALRCASEIQEAMAARNAGIAPEHRIVFRVGIHQGDVVVENGDIFGDGVNIAARLEGLAEPGGICVSRGVRDEVRDKLDFVFDDMGEQQVKNITRPVRAFAIRLGSAAPARPATKPSLPLPDKPSLAVLPFQNMSGDPEQEYFADGMVEEITTAISRFPWLSVVARNSAFTYKGKAVDIRQVARELGVRYVLEGSVRKAGTRVRITGQLIDTATGAHLWADRFDGSLDDIFELQDQVASRVVSTIEPRLRFTEGDRVSRKPPESLDAYDLYLRAVAETNKRTEEGLVEAIRLARRALELDPAFVPAMSSIAGARQLQMVQHWIPSSGAEVEEGIHMAWQALAGSRDNPEVLRRVGLTLATLAGENETALTAIDRAIELNPNYAQAYSHRGIVLAWLNRPEEAIAAAEQAMRLSPNDPAIIPSYNVMCLAHFAAGRIEEALSWAERGLGANVGLAALRYKLSLCGHLGRREEASKCLQRLCETYPEPTVAAVMRDMPKGLLPELAARLAEGLRKAGVPEG